MDELDVNISKIGDKALDDEEEDSEAHAKVFAETEGSVDGRYEGVVKASLDAS